MEITYYGHSCFGVQLGGKKLLFDPFIRYNELAKHIDWQKIETDYILLSHGHEDHVADAFDIATRTGATIVSNFEIVSWYKAKGITKGHEMNHGGQWKFDFGTVKYVNAVHSSVLPDGTYGGNPGGFLVQGTEGNFYYAGDTALTMDMKLIPLTWPKLNLALLPIGNNFTMGVKDAVLAAQFVDVKKVIGLHYDTFGYIKIDKTDAVKQFADAGIDLMLPAIGESITI